MDDFDRLMTLREISDINASKRVKITSRVKRLSIDWINIHLVHLFTGLDELVVHIPRKVSTMSSKYSDFMRNISVNRLTIDFGSLDNRGMNIPIYARASDFIFPLNTYKMSYLNIGNTLIYEDRKIEIYNYYGMMEDITFVLKDIKIPIILYSNHKVPWIDFASQRLDLPNSGPGDVLDVMEDESILYEGKIKKFSLETNGFIKHEGKSGDDFVSLFERIKMHPLKDKLMAYHDPYVAVFSHPDWIRLAPILSKIIPLSFSTSTNISDIANQFALETKLFDMEYSQHLYHYLYLPDVFPIGKVYSLIDYIHFERFTDMYTE